MPTAPSCGPTLLVFWGRITRYSAVSFFLFNSPLIGFAFFFVRTQIPCGERERSSSHSLLSYSHRCEQARSVFTASLQQIMCLLNSAGDEVNGIRPLWSAVTLNCVFQNLHRRPGLSSSTLTLLVMRKEQFNQKWRFRHSLLTFMLMKSQVMIHRKTVLHHCPEQVKVMRSGSKM